MFFLLISHAFQLHIVMRNNLIDKLLFPATQYHFTEPKNSDSNSNKEKDKKEETLAVQGIFVEIGLIPNSDFAVDLNKTKKRPKPNFGLKKVLNKL